MVYTITITNKDVQLPKIVFIPSWTLELDEEDREIERLSMSEYLKFEDSE
jgi:hypothetical protein